MIIHVYKSCIPACDQGIACDVHADDYMYMYFGVEF